MTDDAARNNALAVLADFAEDAHLASFEREALAYARAAIERGPREEETPTQDEVARETVRRMCGLLIGAVREQEREEDQSLAAVDRHIGEVAEAVERVVRWALGYRRAVPAPASEAPKFWRCLKCKNVYPDDAGRRCPACLFSMREPSDSKAWSDQAAEIFRLINGVAPASTAEPPQDGAQ